MSNKKATPNGCRFPYRMNRFNYSTVPAEPKTFSPKEHMRPKSPFVKGGFRGNVYTNHKCEISQQKSDTQRMSLSLSSESFQLLNCAS